MASRSFRPPARHIRFLILLTALHCAAYALCAVAAAAAASAAAVDGDGVECPDPGVAAFEWLSSPDSGVLRVNFSQLPSRLYGTRGNTTYVGVDNSAVSWLLLLYSPYGGYSIDYAPEFAQFARSVAKWRRTLRLAALDTTAAPENAAAPAHYGVTGLPALLFIPRRALWNAPAATGSGVVAMPRDPAFLEDALLAELERYVPSLRPVKSVFRVLRSAGALKADLVVYLEEAPDSYLARRAILDRLAMAASSTHSRLLVRVAWRTNAKLDPGSVSVTIYRRRRRRRHGGGVGGGYERRLRRAMAYSYQKLEAVIDRFLEPEEGKNGSSGGGQPVTSLPLSSSKPAASSSQGCSLRDTNAKPPSLAQLRADAWRILCRDVALCLSVSSASSSAAAASALSATTAFVQLLAASLTDPAMSRLANLLKKPLSLRRLAASGGGGNGGFLVAWQRLLADVGVGDSVGSENEDTNLIDDGAGQWRVLHALTVVRYTVAIATATGTPTPPSTLATVRRLRRACSGAAAVLPSLPQPLPPSPTNENSAAAADEVLTLWRLHNRARRHGRVFPPPNLCPGCLLDAAHNSGGDDQDALAFLAGWYQAAVQAAAQASPRSPSLSRFRWDGSQHPRQLIPPWPAPHSNAEEDETPCILRLLQRFLGDADGGGDDGSVGVNWTRLALLMMLGCACAAAILCCFCG